MIGLMATAGEFSTTGLVSFDDRVGKARDLLLNPHYSVQEIEQELDFESADQFESEFHKVVGEMPQQYRGRWLTALQRWEDALGVRSEVSMCVV